MVVMLCTRCHEREAVRSPSPEARARIEEVAGAPWPLPDGVCRRCLTQVFKEDPELRARLDAFNEKIRAKALTKMSAGVRGAVNAALDVADRIADRVRDALK